RTRGAGGAAPAGSRGDLTLKGSDVGARLASPSRASPPPSEAAVLAALDTVMDPELDESLIKLGFVRAELLEGGRVRIEFRLPTYWCAPNFAYLMAGDACEAVRAVEGVREVELRLTDHFAGDEVTAGAGEGRTFDEAFAELADGGGLEELRRLFWAKSFTMRQPRLRRALLARGP